MDIPNRNLLNAQLWRICNFMALGTEITVKLIIEAAAVLIPSSVTIFTVVRKKLYRRTIKDVLETIQNMEETNKKNFVSINMQLKIHEQAFLLQVKLNEISKKIEEIIRHALEVSTNEKIKKLLIKFSQQFIIFLRWVVSDKIQKVQKEEIVTRFEIILDELKYYGKTILKLANIQQWNTIAKIYINKYYKAIDEICGDNLSNKEERFLSESFDFVHIIIKQFVLFYSAFNSCKPKE